MTNYSVFSLEDTDRLEAICLDILEQKEKGIADCPLFMMPLMPEGNPPVDKAGKFCAAFRLYQTRLAELGVPAGILVQSTLGHDHMTGADRTHFRRYVNLTDGAENVYCPSDPGFQRYFEEAMFTLASCRPAMILVDDDFRMMAHRRGKACVCDWHLGRFNALAGTHHSRETLYPLLCTQTPEAKALRRLFVETQREPMLETARAMRRGIDRADPTIPGGYCACGNNAEFASEIAKILAGKGNPTVLRLNNGNYCNTGLREVCASVSYRAAGQIAKLDKPDILLAETDTCPHNRYSTSAYSMHTNLVASILEGANGAKHWVTWLHGYEPESGRYYRQVLAKYRGFYEGLIELVPKLKWLGCCIPVSSRPVFDFAEDYGDAWFHYALERLGLPLYFSNLPGEAVFLDHFREEEFTGQELETMLSKTVFLTADAGETLWRLGFGEYIGVKIGEAIQGKEEHLSGNRCQVQKSARRLIPLSGETRVDSTVDGLFPAVTVYRNSLGGCAIVFCGSPKARFHLTEGFAFLNGSRKRQLVRLLRAYASLPVYCPWDGEVYFRAARRSNGGLCCVVINTCPDPMEGVPLEVTEPVGSVTVLQPDGTITPCGFTRQDERYVLELTAYPLQPQVIFLNPEVS